VATDSQTIVATYDLGVPIAATETIPVLYFQKTDSSERIYAHNEEHTAINELVVSTSTSGVQCSFAGGCEFEVTSTGLASMIKANPHDNHISICDEICEF